MKDPKDTREDREEAAEATAEERARAQALSRLVDAMLAGEPAPPALPAEDRALLETATTIHATLGRARLGPARTARLVERTFADAVGHAPARTSLRSRSADGHSKRGAPERASFRRRSHWTFALVVGAGAAAAAVLAFVPFSRGPVPRAPEIAVGRPHKERSRPADPLIGPIARADSGEARARIDVLYADRLAGYRALRLKGGAR